MVRGRKTAKKTREAKLRGTGAGLDAASLEGSDPFELAVLDEHVEDLAFQRHVYEGAGMPLRRAVLMHLDGGYRRQGAIDPDALLTRVDLTREVARLQPRIEKRIARLLATLARAKAPKVAIGAHCTSPHACPFIEDCQAFLPEHSVLSLVSGGRKAQRLLSEGVLALRAIPKRELTKRQALQVRAVRRNEPRIDEPALRAFLETLRYPLHLLDFETVATAIPLYDDGGPWCSVPFQYALQIVDEPGARPRRVSFLASGKGDPRPRFLASLKERLGRHGSIVAYNAGFERRILDSCAEQFPEGGLSGAARCPHVTPGPPHWTTKPRCSCSPMRYKTRGIRGAG